MPRGGDVEVEDEVVRLDRLGRAVHRVLEVPGLEARGELQAGLRRPPVFVLTFFLAFGKSWEDLSRMYRSQILQVLVNTKYALESSRRDLQNELLCTVWTWVPKTKKIMGRKESGPYNPGKKWPGEAQKQPQLATQCYLRAQVEECLRIRNKVMTGDCPLNSRRDACEC